MRLAIDGHADTPQRFLDLGERFDDPASRAEVSLHRARVGGLVAQFFSIWVEPDAFPGEAAWQRAQALVESVEEQAHGSAEVALARTHDEVRSNIEQGIFSILFGLEGAHALGARETPISPRLDRLRMLAERGLKYVTLTWSTSNDFAGSSGDRGRDRGLSAHGLELISTCAELGVLVDVSHASDPTFNDVAKWARATSRPLVASHSSARALASSPRNLADDQLRALADTGGIASVNYYPSFLCDAFRARFEAEAPREWRREIHARAKVLETSPGRASLLAFHQVCERARAISPMPTVETVAAHVVHMVNVAGEDHVGLGSDFDGIAAVPAGLEDASALPRLARALSQRGAAPRVIDKVFAENWLRILRAV
ncbi:MAG: membrane dipeptidase [Deltaproteobacteria bacterium]|nr:membrane dipeptidase [Deltaproteobacteria bacterium]